MKMKNETYDFLKFLAQIVLPALATFVTGFAVIWRLPYGEPIGATVMLVDAFLGAVLKVSTDNYNKEVNNG